METEDAALSIVGSLIVVVLVIALLIWPYFKIFSKAGFSGWLALLMLVPLVNIAMLFFLAFAEWPALRNRQSS
jgi:hypothetical protein